MVIFVDRFDWEARGNCDGQQVLVLDVESLGFLCVGNVKTIGLAKSASNVFNRSFICTDPNLFPIRSGVGLSQSSKHLVHEAIEFFFFFTNNLMAKGDNMGCVELSDTFDAGWICRSRLHLLEFEVALFEVHQ